VPVGVSGAVGGWRHAASQWKTLASEADERVLLSKMQPIPFSQEVCAWESQLERHSTDVTIVTQLSVDRISRLEAMTQTWAGVVSAAVLLPPPHFCAQRKSALNQLAQLHERVEARGECRLDIATLHVEAATRVYDTMYPINALRNLALDQAKSALVFLLDIDFEVSSNLYSELQSSYQTVHDAAVHSRTALVIPAFECESLNTMPNCQEQMVQALDAEDAELFHTGHFAKGHRATDLARWRHATEAYPVQYEECFEPYVIAARTLIPRYDERFRGYGMNKIAHILHMDALHFEFWVVPHHFVCAAKHAKSSQWEATYASSGAKLQQRRIAALFRQVRKELIDVRKQPVQLMPLTDARVATATAVTTVKPPQVWCQVLVEHLLQHNSLSSHAYAA